jgi:hypothetical protein
MVAAGETIGVLTPGAEAATSSRVLVLWIGQIVAGLGAAAVFPTSLAMVAAGTHTPRAREGALAAGLLALIALGRRRAPDAVATWPEGATWQLERSA